jgi:excinuclease ABC subunit C
MERRRLGGSEKSRRDGGAPVVFMAKKTELIIRMGDPEVGKVVVRLPRSPGVYLMQDSEGTIIYIGKAKSLRDRVRSYFAGFDERHQVRHLLKRVKEIQTIVVQTEAQALVLEGDLIKQHRPRYNIRMKDDKSYLSVRIDYNAEWPRLELVRRVADDGATYLGPYASAGELRGLLDLLRGIVPLRNCADIVFNNRQRPCLEYEIKRCAGPCCLPVDREEYREWLKQAERILQGKAAGVMEEFRKRMDRAAEDLRFEEAAAYRDKITLLEKFSSGNEFNMYQGEEYDVIGLYREGGLVAFVVLQVRGGRIRSTKSFELTDVVPPNEELLSTLLRQFYADTAPSSAILIPWEIEDQNLLETLFSQQFDRTIEVQVPQRGVKARLLKIAEMNARQNFRRAFEGDTQRAEVARDLTKLLKLRQTPRRIECVDISNLQGSDIVASVVAFADGVPDKTFYRHYKISFQDKPNDFAAIQEVVSRRLARGLRDDDLPDLIVIDGGAAQLASAVKAFEEVRNAKGGEEWLPELVALAKERTRYRDGDVRRQVPERVFILGQEESIPLLAASPVTHLLQEIRDEAHRFAITFHRKRRSKRVMRSELQDVPGLPAHFARRLLKVFGSVEAIRGVSAEELALKGKIPPKIAENVVTALAAKSK